MESRRKCGERNGNDFGEIREGQRKEVWDNKKKLKRRKERIVEDLSWGGRKMRWRLEEKERKRGKENRIWRRYGKLKINEQWWK